MRFSINRDLGIRLLALYLLLVGPVVAATLVFDFLASRRLEQDVRSNDIALARAIAQETNKSLENALEAVERLAEYPAVLEGDQQGMEDLFNITLNVRPDIGLIYRLDAAGIMQYHYPSAPESTVGVDFSFRDYFKKARDASGPLLSLGRISPTTGQPVATAVMPLRDAQGVFTGVVATNIKLETLSETLASISDEQQTIDRLAVMIVDAGGMIIAHSDIRYLLLDLADTAPQVSREVLAGQANNQVTVNDRGEEILYSYVPIPGAGWGVIVSRPTEVAFATPRTFHQIVIISIGVFMIIGLFFWVALSQQVIMPLERLAAFSRSIGQKQELSPSQRKALQEMATRPDQMGHLIRSLTRMEQNIQKRLEELSTLLQTSGVVLSSLDPETVLDNILEQVSRLMGMEKYAIVALDEKRGAFRVQASRGLSRRYVEQISSDAAGQDPVTLQAIRSGEPIQVSDTEDEPVHEILRQQARSEGYRAVLAVPLIMKHAPPSALLVYLPEPHTFSEREINLLKNFANHAAMAIENAALYVRSDNRLQEQTRRLEALIQSFQDGLILENLEGKVLYANRRISELIDLPPEEISGASVENLFERLLLRTVGDDLLQTEKNRQAVFEVLHSRGDRSVEFSILGPRRMGYLRLQVFEVTDSQGMLIGRGQILRDITNRKELDWMKTSLISTVSHELRTPLAAIKGYASTLLAEDVEWDPQTQREFISIISSEADRLGDLVNDLLDMSRIEAGNLTVSKQACDLAELTMRAMRRVHPYPGSRLQMDFPHNLPVVYADPKRIEAVLRNLIENAAKYAGDESPICISAQVRAGALIVRVEDEGPGIAAEHSQRVFESFYRIDQGLVREAPGAGLGLAICQGFVHAHGGEIWLEPRPVGTCVAFSLPIQRVLPLAEAGPISGEPLLQAAPERL